uniref:Uncharacterized protein n=1 Tax=Candidatus Kentrum sp. LPFa TaxID=2126335 RepID=A0A450WZ53_9GAMM|nr:MAG: hypothetical protein BECKLPF1236B_GA0070989_13034 [Candidatus Kentron sp. LPFa]
MFTLQVMYHFAYFVWVFYASKLDILNSISGGAYFYRPYSKNTLKN